VAAATAAAASLGTHARALGLGSLDTPDKFQRAQDLLETFFTRVAALYFEALQETDTCTITIKFPSKKDRFSRETSTKRGWFKSLLRSGRSGSLTQSTATAATNGPPVPATLEEPDSTDTDGPLPVPPSQAPRGSLSVPTLSAAPLYFSGASSSPTSALGAAASGAGASMSIPKSEQEYDSLESDPRERAHAQTAERRSGPFRDGSQPIPRSQTLHALPTTHGTADRLIPRITGPQGGDEDGSESDNGALPPPPAGAAARNQPANTYDRVEDEGDKVVYAQLSFVQGTSPRPIRQADDGVVYTSIARPARSGTENLFGVSPAGGPAGSSSGASSSKDRVIPRPTTSPYSTPRVAADLSAVGLRAAAPQPPAGAAVAVAKSSTTDTATDAGQSASALAPGPATLYAPEAALALPAVGARPALYVNLATATAAAGSKYENVGVPGAPIRYENISFDSAGSTGSRPSSLHANAEPAAAATRADGGVDGPQGPAIMGAGGSSPGTQRAGGRSDGHAYSLVAAHAATRPRGGSSGSLGALSSQSAAAGPPGSSLLGSGPAVPPASSPNSNSTRAARAGSNASLSSHTHTSSPGLPSAPAAGSPSSFVGSRPADWGATNPFMQLDDGPAQPARCPGSEIESTYQAQKWYHGGISSRVALAAVEAYPQGAFLVRRSETQPGLFVLCVNWLGHAYFFRVAVSPNGSCNICGVSFASLPALIAHYTLEPLPTTPAQQGQVVRLTQVVPRSGVNEESFA
jgi:hypothetical protein